MRLGLAPPDAEDLVQELYVLLLRPTDEPDEPVRDWFRYHFGYLQKLAANTWTRERRRLRLLEQHAAVAPVDPGHEARLLARLTVAKMLDDLPPADAELLLRRFAEDWLIGEIAERLGIPEGTVKSRLHGALKKARVVLGIERPS